MYPPSPPYVKSPPSRKERNLARAWLTVVGVTLVGHGLSYVVTHPEKLLAALLAAGLVLTVWACIVVRDS